MNRGAGVDYVVAGVLIAVGQREYPLVIFVVSIGERGEGIKRLVTEFVSQHVLRMAAVPHAVLGGVAINDQR